MIYSINMRCTLLYINFDGLYIILYEDQIYHGPIFRSWNEYLASLSHNLFPLLLRLAFGHFSETCMLLKYDDIDKVQFFHNLQFQIILSNNFVDFHLEK